MKGDIGRKMKKQDVTKFFKTIQNGLKKHSPEILTGVGILGMISTTIAAVNATPKAMELIEEKKKELGLKPDEKLTRVETVKTAWKPYIPTIVTGTAAIACLVGGSKISARRNAALITAYQISTTALNEYKEKVVETVGETTAKEIREKIVEKRKHDGESSANDISETRARVYIPDGGDVLFHEPISNHYFKSSKNKIGEAVNYLNGRMIDGQEMYMSLNEFLDEFDLKHSIIGNDIGWTVDRRIDITFDLSESERGEPCYEIVYIQPPEHGFNELY